MGIRSYVIICSIISLLAGTVGLVRMFSKENVAKIHKSIEKEMSDSRFKISYFGRSDRFVLILDTKYNREYIGYSSFNSALVELNLTTKE